MVSFRQHLPQVSFLGLRVVESLAFPVDIQKHIVTPVLRIWSASVASSCMSIRKQAHVKDTTLIKDTTLAQKVHLVKDSTAEIWGGSLEVICGKWKGYIDSSWVPRSDFLNPQLYTDFDNTLK